MARALYIHWPFCLAKCPYCDFNSHVRDTVDHERWKAGLVSELRREHEATRPENSIQAAGRSGDADTTLTSIFFGGGTPSLMPPALVETLLREAQDLWGFAPDIEIALEGNPSSIEAANYSALAAAGINRVSLGIQALDDETLRFLGRLHSAREALDALDIAQKRFERVSFDLIYARPGQSVEEWRAELDRALGFGTGHLSLYQLTIEPGTRFETMVRKGDFFPLDEDASADMFALTRESTAAAGLPAYEVSNHARAGEESRHNLTYWRYQDYCGIGPGAHGRRGGLATTRHRKPENWLNAIAARGEAIREARPLPGREQASEAMLMGLRLTEGVDIEALSRRFAIAPDALHDPRKAAFYEAQGLLWRDGPRLGVSDAGIALLDALLAEIVPADLVFQGETL